MSGPLHLFEGFGIEIEYMIVDRDSLDVAALADQVIRKVAGDYVNDVERGPLAWSNELAGHVIEMKTNGPAPALAPLPALFQAGVADINAILAEFNATLMPGAMHPWMDPDTETRLWPHGDKAIYAAYHRIFDCRGHGWSNLQSMHVNLPFGDEAEFVALHAAIRAALPLAPMLAASSPFADARATGYRDYRMQVYRHNAARIPSITGRVVPEPVRGFDDYRQVILAPMYADIAPHDIDGLLGEEWLNSRGAIARFDRDAIEIRVLDTQECPLGDLAVASAMVNLVRELVAAGPASTERLNALPTEALAALFLAAIRDGEDTVIEHGDYLRALGLGDSAIDGRTAWSRLVERRPPEAEPLARALEHILRHGTLASRILRAAGDRGDRARLYPVYQALCEHLVSGEPYVPGR